MRQPYRAREITSYFGAQTGLGLALRQFPRQQNQRIGLLGLGVGTVTALEPLDDDVKLVVRFLSVGPKTLRAKFAKLEPA